MIFQNVVDDFDCLPGDVCLPQEVIVCPGGCPPPNEPGNCTIFLDGDSTGANVFPVVNLPVGSLVTCECPEPPFDQKCQHCGPGPHWIDTCPAGTDNMPTGAVVGIDTTFDCLADTNLILFGPAVVDRAAGVPHDITPTEIISMVLAGGGATMRGGAGQGVGPLGALLQASFGQIVEQNANPLFGDSSFGVFVEIELGDTVRVRHYPHTSAVEEIEVVARAGQSKEQTDG